MSHCAPKICHQKHKIHFRFVIYTFDVCDNILLYPLLLAMREYLGGTSKVEKREEREHHSTTCCSVVFKKYNTISQHCNAVDMLLMFCYLPKYSFSQNFSLSRQGFCNRFITVNANWGVVLFINNAFNWTISIYLKYEQYDEYHSI